MKPYVNEMWRCRKCGKDHDEAVDAVECCGATASMVATGPIHCGRCGKRYLTRKDAEYCCSPEQVQKEKEENIELAKWQREQYKQKKIKEKMEEPEKVRRERYAHKKA